MNNLYKRLTTGVHSLGWVCLALVLQCCHPSVDPQVKGSVADKKISQFERAGYCDFLIDKAGVYHVVFQESPAIGKPVFIYHSTSSDKGNSWSKPVNISNDNTGNGSGYARLLQDGSGTLYAIWKRYGSAQFLQGEAYLDGPGGTDLGTISYSVLNGGTWSQPVRISETEQTQDTWFATLTPQGKVAVFWAQLGPAAQQESYSRYYWYCDYLRDAVLSGTGKPTIYDLTTPWVKKTQYELMPRLGIKNLDGYVDATGTIHLTFENISADGVEQVIYFNGKTTQIAYSYPRSSTTGSYRNPAKLLIDEKGVDHLIFLPPSSTLESEQVWDINLPTNTKTIIFNFQNSGSRISGFQATQGPNGKMGVVVEANPKRLANVEAYGCFYENGVWQFGGLTSNASKDDFKSTSLNTYYGTAYFASLTSYHSSFASVAWDGSGRRRMALTLAAQWIGTGGYSTSSPSIVFVPIDQ